MQQDVDSSGASSALFGALVAVGLVLGGWVLGAQIKATRLGDRYVSVKGLVERQVKSDQAVWSIGYKQVGDDLSGVYAKTEADMKSILAFLKQEGLSGSDIQTGIPHVVDTQANEYGNGNRAPHRFIVEREVTVNTAQVDKVAAAAQKTVSLLQKGIILNNDRGRGLVYKFSGLNSIKPDMITEATRNARAAADRFALDSGSKVGSIRQANQGVFSILAADPESGFNDEGVAGGAANSDSSLIKTVRVVTSVQYYLEK